MLPALVAGMKGGDTKMDEKEMKELLSKSPTMRGDLQAMALTLMACNRLGSVTETEIYINACDFDMARFQCVRGLLVKAGFANIDNSVVTLTEKGIDWALQFEFAVTQSQTDRLM